MFYRIKLEQNIRNLRIKYISNLVGLIFQKRFNSRHFFSQNAICITCAIYILIVFAVRTGVRTVIHRLRINRAKSYTAICKENNTVVVH